MSATDIIGIIGSAIQFSVYISNIVNYIDQNRKAGKDYHEDLVNLKSKLRSFEITLNSLKRAATTIRTSRHRTKMESFALKPMTVEINETERILEELFTCHQKFQPPKNRSTLMLVFDYWSFNNNGKAIIKGGISEITDRIEAIKGLVTEIHTHVATDARDISHDTHNLVRQMTGDHPRYSRTSTSSSTTSNASSASNTSNNSWGSAASDSTDLTSYSDDETEPSLDPASKWNIDLPAYEEVVGESSSLAPAMISAIEGKNYKTVAGLLKSGTNPLAVGDSGWCVFHYAVRAGSKTVMRELLDSKKVKDLRGFDVRDIHGDTPLHFASRLGMKAMARELLKAGSNKDAVNHSGQSPLYIAVDKKQVGMVEVLLEYEAECTPPNPDKLRKILNEINYLKSKAA